MLRLTSLNDHLPDVELSINGRRAWIQQVEWSMGKREEMFLNFKAVLPPETEVQHAERKRRDLIYFAKTGAPPVEPFGFTSTPPALEAEGNISDHAWVDSSPTYSAVLAARDEKHPTRCVPRLVDQKPYDQIVQEQFTCPCHETMGNDFWFLPKGTCLRGKCEGKRGVRPESPSDFAMDFHASNQRWWRDLVTGEKLDRNMGEMLMLVVSEIAEAMEGERKDLMDDHLPHRKMAEVELADGIIRIADIVGSMGREEAKRFEARLGEIEGTDRALVDNKGEQLRRICVPLCSITSFTRNHFIVNKLARAWHRIELYAEKYGYDLWGAVFEKMEYNKTRADHKPEARLAANGKKF